MKIEKKCWPEFFEKILSGEKQFEIRLADFECNPGDILVLKEWNSETMEYTGREIEKEVTYVMNVKDMDQCYSKAELEKYGLIVISLNNK